MKDTKTEDKNEQHMENAGLVRALATACKIRHPNAQQQQFRDELCKRLATLAPSLAFPHVQRAHDALCDVERRSLEEVKLLTVMQLKIAKHYGLPIAVPKGKVTRQ
jgi:hypothetical protein